VAATAVLSAAIVLPSRIVAAASSADSAPTTTVEVVATGLNVPRGLVYDREHHRLLIAEAGVAAGNTAPCAPGGNGTLCYGATGSVYSFSLNPNKESGRIITGLPSLSNPAGNFVQGLEDLSLYHGRLEGAIALNATPDTRTALGPDAANLGQAVAFGPRGQVTPIADIATLETQLYGPTAKSDPWGIASGRFGTLIADAAGAPAAGSDFGGNDVLQLKHGTLTQLVAFPQRPVPGNASKMMDSAPSTVVQGPDGAFYVGELTSFPYPPGGAVVWRVVPGQQPTVFASGFSKVIDIAFDSRGRLLVLDTGGRNSPEELFRVDRDGTQTLLVAQSQGLNDPSGIAVVNDHTFYITNNGSGTGGDGQLLKVTVNGD
jgi:hypothetical protein